MSSVFADHDGVRIHALDNERAGSLVPLVAVPGMGESADEFAWMLDALGDRRVLIVDVRGRGGSDAPESGYTWEHHYGDVLAAIEHAGIERPVMLGNSRGTAYALGAALHSSEPVRGVVINDYQARHVGLADDASEWLLKTRTRGRTLAERMDPRVVEQVVRDSEEISLWDRLATLDCPILVMGGGRAGSIVTDEIVERYRAARPDIEIARIADQGHDLWSRDTPTYLGVLLPFLARIDAA